MPLAWLDEGRRRSHYDTRLGTPRTYDFQNEDFSVNRIPLFVPE